MGEPLMDGVEREVWRRSEPVLITAHGPADSLGRQQFTTTWLDTNIGPRCDEHGRRGQVSYAVIADAVAGWEAHGYTVEVTEFAAGVGVPAGDGETPGG